MSEQPKSGRKKVARMSVAAALTAALVLLVPWKRCQNMIGIGGGTGNGEYSEPPGGGPGAGGGGGSAGAPVQATPRCQVRLDAEGITVDGKRVERDDAVKACKAAGAADVVVTGDASQGGWDALRNALSEAAVEIYVRGPSDTTGLDGGVK